MKDGIRFSAGAAYDPEEGAWIPVIWCSPPGEPKRAVWCAPVYFSKPEDAGRTAVERLNEDAAEAIRLESAKTPNPN